MTRTWLCAIVVALGSTVASTVAQTPTAPVTITLPQIQQFTNTGRQLVAISPDGARVVYVANARLYVTSLVEPSQPSEIEGTATTPGAVTSPVFAPDGRSVAFWSAADQTLKRVPVTGGTPSTITRADNPFGISWGPDDRIVFGQGQKGVLRVAATGGTPEIVATVASDELAHGPQMLPGGGALLMTIASASPTAGVDRWNRSQIVAYVLKTGERKILVRDATDGRFLSTGHLVYAVNGTLFASRFDPTRLEVIETPARIADGVAMAGATGSAHFAVSDTSTLVYVPPSTGKVQLALVDRNGNREHLGQLRNSVFAPRLSPDGKQIAFDAESRVWIADLASLDAARPLTGVGNSNFPLWTPDGRRVLFVSARDGAAQSVFWQRADGTDDAELLVAGARAPEAWSMRGERLSYITLKPNADYDIWTYTFADKQTSPVVETPLSGQSGSHFSPDGRWVAYESNESGRSEVFVQPFPSSGPRFQVTKNGGSRPLWSADGRELFFDQGQRLFVVAVGTQPTFSSGEPMPLPIAGFAQGALRRQYDITSDGKRFLMMFAPPAEIKFVINSLTR